MKNEQKGKMYTETIRRYKRAVESQFYFECLLFDYALIEDRLSDFFLQTEIAARNTDRKIHFRKNRKKDLIESGIPEAKLSFSTMKSKSNLLQMILESIETPVSENNIQIIAMKTVLKRNRIVDLLTISFFDELRDWQRTRNVIVHNLMNSAPSEIDSVQEAAEKGFELFRILDRSVAKIKGKTKKETGRLLKQRQMNQKRSRGN